MLGINNNIGNYRAQDALALNHSFLQVSLERLSTGVRINRAEDDASGLVLRDRFGAQMGSLEEAIRNIQAGQGMIQVAEEGINKITDALQAMRQLAVRAADDNLNDDDRSDIQQQIKALLKEVNDRAEKTKYNGRRLLDGSITEAKDEQKSSASIQTNAILRDGTKLMDIDLAKATNSTTFGAVSQGSYEVKLVFSDEARASASHNTTLEGALNSNGSGQGSITQTIYDKDGVAHDATFTFIEGASHQWSYVANIEGGGAFEDNVTASGTVTFKDVVGSDLDPMDHGRMIENSLTMSSNTGVHTQGALTYVDLTKGTLTMAIKDGSQNGQSYTLDFSRLVENEVAPAAPAVLPDLNVNGTAGSQTAANVVTGRFDTAAAVGSTVTIASSNWRDRVGVAHGVDFTFTKLASGDGINTGDTWKYTLGGVGQSGVWTGNNENDHDVVLQFDAAGAIQSVNGAAGGTVIATLGDGTASGQEVELDFSAMTSAAGAIAPAQAPDGAAGTPSTAVDFIGLGADNRIISGNGPTTFQMASFIDRTGTTSVPGGAITFTQVDDSNVWNYQIKAPSDSGFTGTVLSGGSGQVEFQDDGDLVTTDPLKPVQFTVRFDDGTTEGQTFTLTLENSTATGLKMAKATDLRKSESDGGPGTADPQVDAVIYWTDGGKAPTIVSTLLGVSEGTKSYEAGGVILTVNTASRYDVGVVAFAKTLTYVSATSEDNALQFQTGSDEGEVYRVGIERMTVDALFRRDYYKGDEDRYAKLPDYDTEDGGSLSVATTLQSQDLIGQIDDALRLVGRANLRVGAFKNEFDRTLEYQRSNHTQVANAYANMNDADLAVEATKQSKNMILIQSATAMVAQANTSSQFVLQLLR